MILRLPCSVTEPPSLEGQPAHITHASGQTLSELHTRQERSPSLALLLPFSNSSFPPRAFLTLPSAIRMTILLPTAANSTPFSDPVTLSSNGGGILLQSTKKQIKQSYKVESHHPQSRTVSLPKAAVPTSDAQRHKSSSLKQTHFKTMRIRMWFYNIGRVYLLPKEQSHLSPGSQLRAFPLSSLCLSKCPSRPTENQFKQLNWQAAIHWFGHSPTGLTYGG